MQKEGDYIKISVIVCTYSKELFSETIECINSLSAQNYVNKEILLVMDKNDELHQMLLSGVPKSVNILINTNPGLSEARNLGIQNANGDVIAFIDDDAVADAQYISNLIKNYEDEKVIGVVGKILPRDLPNYPEELYWVGGFTYKGFPEERCEVRNVHGCNMSFRREVFDKAGFFNVTLGRVGRKLVTAEETEFSIRVLNSLAGCRIIYDPEAIVYHKVHDYRETFGYLVQRGYFEGKSKAHIEMMYNNLDGGNKTLSTENTYLKYLLINAIPRRLKNILIMRDIMLNTKDIVLLMAVIGSVGIGYIIRKIR